MKKYERPTLKRHKVFARATKGIVVTYREWLIPRLP